MAKKVRRKEEIISVACKLFVEKGFEKTTMKDIADTIGVFKGSLYHHINSKAELVYEIFMRSLPETTELLREVRTSDLEPEQKFRKIMEVHFQNILTYSLDYQVLLSERRHMLEPKQEREVRRGMKLYEDEILDVIEEGIKAKVFRDDLNPRVVLGGIMGIGNSLHKWFSPAGPLTYDEVTQTYIEFFLNGIIAR